MVRAKPPTIHLKDYRPPTHLVETVALDVKLDAVDTRVRSRLSVVPNPVSPEKGAPLALDGEGIELHAVRLDGRQLAPSAYEVAGKRLVLHAPPARRFELEIETGCSPKANTELSGLYLSNGIYCTQCEAEGFRRITYFPDRPDVLSRFSVRLEADKNEAPVLLANGNLKESGDVAGTSRHFALWEDPFPKPAYLFAMVGGDLAAVEDGFTTMSGRKVALRIFVERGKEDRCGWAMESIKASMAWDEKAYGREYDLDVFMVVAVSMFNMGAMENKGLNIFNDKYVLAQPESATDLDYVNIEAIIAHEYFHNWTGNRITCRDWFQLCLKEGLTVFRDQEFSSDMRSRAVKRIQDVRTLRAQQFPEDAGPLAHPVRPASYIEINNFYTATVYEKGAEIVRMMKTLLGPANFRKAMDLYFERHDGEAATVEDFVACMADASGRDLKPFFRWYRQAGTPEVRATGTYDARKKVYELRVTQRTPPTPGQAAKQPLHIPLAVGLVGPNGHDMALETAEGPLDEPILELTKRSQTFRFTNIGSRPVPSINRGFSAPIRLKTNLPEKDLIFLMANDGDPFNRWEACQSLSRALIVDAMAKHKARRSPAAPRAFADALKHTLADARLDAQFLALMLSLPTEQDIAGDMTRNVDPDLVHRARDGLRARLGRTLAPELLRIYEASEVKGTYSPDPVSSGKRALRHATLALYAAGDPQSGAELAIRHFREARNMTDTIGALTALLQIDVPERDQALELFLAKHGDDHLLVDKWFSLHAQVPSADAPARVRSLLDHALFNWQSPNRFRALLGTFAAFNPVGFHAADGAGYRLVAEAIVKLDRSNPQVAARLAGSFKTHRSLEAKRRALARRALRTILDATPLSRDTYEIVTRSMA